MVMVTSDGGEHLEHAGGLGVAVGVGGHVVDVRLVVWPWRISSQWHSERKHRSRESLSQSS